MTMSRPGSIIILLLGLCAIANGYKILSIFTVPGTSHHNFDISVVKTLADAGHDVTVFSLFPPDKSIKNINFIQINMPNTVGNFNFFDFKDWTFYDENKFLLLVGEEVCKTVFADPNIKELLNAKGKYDVLVVEAFFADCLVAFAHVLDIPLIQIVSFTGFAPFVTDLVGTPRPFAYIPDIFTCTYHPMNFWGRLANLYKSSLITLARSFFYLPKLDKITREFFNDPNLPSISEMELKTSLLMINSHESMSIARPQMPNTVYIGGVHVKEPKPLSEKLKKYLDDSKDGAVLFSLGSNLKTIDMPIEKREIFIKAISKLKQRVVWKWESDEPMPGKPANAYVDKWLPQSDILNHPNMKFFITHGGLMGMVESLNNGVPLIGIPIYGDQEANLKIVEEREMGITLYFDNITETNVDWLFEEILKPKYRENAKKYSAIYHDRVQTPKESVVWWVEYVIRHKGAKHLRAPGIDMPWYQYYLLDVLGFSLIVVWLGFKILKTIICYVCNRQQKHKLKMN